MGKTLKWLLTIVLILAFVGLLLGCVKWNELELFQGEEHAVAQVENDTATSTGEDNGAATEDTNAGTETESTEDTVWYYIHNSECLANDTTEDDFNFGLRPDIENMTTQELYELLKDVMKLDPVIGAAILAYVDKICGTRFDGEFFDVSRNSAEAINLAKDRFIEDPELYATKLEAFFSFVESAAYKISVVHYTSGIRDQMYINPFTGNDIPDVVVFETVQEDGYFLRFDLKIKGSTVGGNPAAGNGGDNVGTIALLLRADCLFQPCNVAEVLDIVPQKNPAKTTPAKTTPSSSTPSKKPVQPVTPVDPIKPKPVVAPSYKDKSKGTQGDLVKPNDNPGPGPDTNTGVGSKTSSAEKPTNTGQSGQSYSDYKAGQKELAEINKTQKTGKDPVTPSYTPAPTTTTAKPAVDNNGGSGTGNGGANTATPKSSEATYGGGNSIPSSGGATEAPPD